MRSAAARQQPASGGRLILLLALLATVLLWLQHHLGFEIAKLGWVTAIAGAASAIEKIIDWLDEKPTVDQAQKGAIRPLRNFVRWASRPGPLIGFFVVLGIPMLLLTSITVTAEQAVSEPTNVMVVALDAGSRVRQDSVTSHQSLARFFPVVTNPFGRPFRVSAKGYLPATATVYPVVGHNIVLGRDLVPAPSVLFRPLAEGSSALQDKGVFQVSRMTAKGTEVLSADTGFDASFRLGPARPISSAIIDFWRLQLEAMNAPSSQRAQMLMLWNAPRQLKWTGDLSPGDSLCAEILRRDTVVARANVTVSREPLVDVLVVDLPPSSMNACPPPRSQRQS